MSRALKSVSVLLRTACVFAAASDGWAGAAQERNAREIAAADPAKHSAAVHGDWTSKLRRPAIQSEPAGRVFGSKHWKSPPPRAVAKAESSPPPFPFHYMGRVEIEGQPATLYLTKGRQVYGVSVGGVIDGIYRIEELTIDRIEVTYLPLSKKQMVAFSSTMPPVQPNLAYAGASPSVPTPQLAAASISSSTVQARSVGSGQARGASVVGGKAPGSGPDVIRQPGPMEGRSSGTMVISAPTIVAMPTSPATTREMPMSAPSGQSMPILPPSGAGMPVTPPAGSR